MAVRVQPCFCFGSLEKCGAFVGRTLRDKAYSHSCMFTATQNSLYIYWSGTRNLWSTACTCMHLQGQPSWSCRLQHSKASVQITCGVIIVIIIITRLSKPQLALVQITCMWSCLRPKSTPDVLERAIMEGYEHRVSPSREGVQVLRMYFFIKG